MNDWFLSRRRFILLSALSTAAASAWAACARFQPSPALTPEEKRIVEALADQVIPPDEASPANPANQINLNVKLAPTGAAVEHRAATITPGGKDAGVAEFIDRQLRGPYRRYRDAYKAGLARIDATSRRAEGRPFVELPFARQTALLEAIEADRVPPGIWEKGEASDFFRLVTDHCLQGFYGSPRHGGNRNYASWKMLGLDQPQILGRLTGTGQ